MNLLWRFDVDNVEHTVDLEFDEFPLETRLRVWVDGRPFLDESAPVLPEAYPFCLGTTECIIRHEWDLFGPRRYTLRVGGRILAPTLPPPEEPPTTLLRPAAPAAAESLLRPAANVTSYEQELLRPARPRD